MAPNSQGVHRTGATPTEALEELLRRHGSEIKAVAFLIVRSEGDADEVVSDTMLTAWRKIGQLRDARTLRPWLLQIASRLALRRRRRFEPQLVNLEAARDVAGQATDPISRLALAEAIDRLPMRTRAAIALHYVADLPVAEIADVMGTSQNTVKTQLREGREKLRSWLRHPRSADLPSPNEAST